MGLWLWLCRLIIYLEQDFTVDHCCVFFFFFFNCCVLSGQEGPDP